jgi:RNA polymerase sigma factor (sigma-70 family)
LGDYWIGCGIKWIVAPKPNFNTDAMKDLTDQETFLGLKSSDNHAYEILYKFYYPSVRHFILKNNGSIDDAKDVFQETICVLLEKVPKDDFNLTSSLKTYIFAISSNLWLKRLRDSNKIVKGDVDLYEKYLTDYEEAETEIHQANTNKALNIFKIITVKCITLLKAIFYDEKNIETVTKEFGYTNKHNAQNQKFKCLEQARKGTDNLN